MMKEGLYEELISQWVQAKLSGIDRESYHVKEVAIDKEEAAEILSRHLISPYKQI